MEKQVFTRALAVLADLIRNLGFFVAVSFLLGACADVDPRLPELVQGRSENEKLLVERGARVYRGTCVSCHSFDPREEGPVGPSLAGSSLDLLKARILHADYPAGYEPKRPTHKMMKMPHLQSQIPALHSYLSAYQELKN